MPFLRSGMPIVARRSDGRRVGLKYYENCTFQFYSISGIVEY
jgi:hypothetical protein